MIRAPRETGAYRDRDLDCQEAIEPEFLRFAYGETAFIDTESIRKTVIPKALQSGWSQKEVDAALTELSRCYARRVPSINPPYRRVNWASGLG